LNSKSYLTTEPLLEGKRICVMPAANQQLSKYDVIARLLHLMDNITEDQQFLLLKQLFTGKVIRTDSNEELA
jgi:hypothetical protein